MLTSKMAFDLEVGLQNNAAEKNVSRLTASSGSTTLDLSGMRVTKNGKTDLLRCHVSTRAKGTAVLLKLISKTALDLVNGLVFNGKIKRPWLLSAFSD